MSVERLSVSPIENITVGVVIISEAVNDNVIISPLMAFVGSVLFDTTVILFKVGGSASTVIDELFEIRLPLFPKISVYELIEYDTKPFCPD